MENLQRLLRLYSEDERIQQIVETLKQNSPSRLLLKGMIGAQESFVLSGTFLSDPRPYLFIASDKETAAYLQNNISNLFFDRPSRNSRRNCVRNRRNL